MFGEVLMLLIAASAVIPFVRGFEDKPPVSMHENPDLANNLDGRPEESDDATVSPMTTASRTKRIVHGLKMVDIGPDKQTFDALKYFVVINLSHQCSLFQRHRFNSHFKYVQLDLYSNYVAHCVSPSRDQRCSGSLIAPNTVQTACHCLATFYKFRPIDNRTSALQKSVWEDHSLIFRPVEDPSDEYRPEPGSEKERQYMSVTTLTSVAEREFMFTKKFYVHRKCTHLDKRAFSHDFGLIILNKNYLKIEKFFFGTPRPLITARPPDMNQQDMAPIYTTRTAEENWLWVQRVEPTCLIIGSGWAHWSYGLYLELPTPWQITHTWRSAISYTFCANWTVSRIEGLQVDGEWLFDGMKTTYEDLASWICTVPLNYYRYRLSGLGDDGGPFTCNNRYIGVLGAGFQQSNKFPYLTEVEFAHSISFATEVHAEYRMGLSELVADERPFLDPQIRDFDPVVYHNLKRKQDSPFVKREAIQNHEYHLKNYITSNVPNEKTFLPSLHYIFIILYFISTS